MSVYASLCLSWKYKKKRDYCARTRAEEKHGPAIPDFFGVVQGGEEGQAFDVVAPFFVDCCPTIAAVVGSERGWTHYPNLSI